MIIIGMGMGLTIPIFNTTAQNAFDESQIGTVSSGVQFARSMGSTIGSAVLGTIVTTSLVNKFADLNTGNIPGEIAGTIKNTQVFSNPEILKGIESKLPNTLLPEFNNVVAQMKQMLCDSIGMVFTICVVISVIAVIIALFMKEKPLVKRQPKEEPVVTSNEK
jgi:MFS family permease